MKTTIAGAMSHRMGTALSGLYPSLVISFTASAIGWSRPQGPTRLGPYLAWKRPRSFRSSTVRNGTIEKITRKITIDLTIRIQVASA